MARCRPTLLGTPPYRILEAQLLQVAHSGKINKAIVRQRWEEVFEGEGVCLGSVSSG